MPFVTASHWHWRHASGFQGRSVSLFHWHNARIRKKKLWQSSKHLNISQLSRKLHFMSINPWLLQISWVIPPGLPYSHPALWAERAIAAVSWASQAVLGAQKETPKKGCCCQSVPNISEVSQFEGNITIFRWSAMIGSIYKHHTSACHSLKPAPAITTSIP